MANASKTWICLALGLLLSACGQATSPVTGTPIGTPIDLDTIRTSAAATAYVQLTGTAWALTATATAQPTPTRTPRPIPTLIPTLDPPQIPGKLLAAISIQSLTPFQGHTGSRVTGWASGYDSFEWLGNDHLLLYPVVGQYLTEPWGEVAQSYPAVINLRSQKVWIPAASVPAERIGFFGPPMLPRWSAHLGALIAQDPSESAATVVTYSPDGQLLKTYPGKLLGISPSGTKLLMADNTWIDLISGKKVSFAWQPTDVSSASFYMRPIWSQDETRVYACCYHYGDAKTGAGLDMPRDAIMVDGIAETVYLSDKFADLDNFYGTWVRDGKYMLSQWGNIADSNPRFVPLFDPAAGTYHDLRKLAGLLGDKDPSLGPYCFRTSTAPNGNYVWMECDGADYLVDLTSFKSTSFPTYSSSGLDWSADGRYAFFQGSDVQFKSFSGILSVAGTELKPVAALDSCRWHPTEDVLACQSYLGGSLSLWRAQTGSILKKLLLPTDIQDLTWSPDGKQLALLAGDSSLWQIAYPNLDHLSQLTPAMPQLTQPGLGGRVNQSLIKNVAWSPDGNFLAFIGGTDIYIIDTK